MTALSSIEINVIKDVLNKSFTKSAETLSFFMKEKIEITEPNLKVETIEKYSKVSFKKDTLFILKTKINGSITGSSYLVLSQPDAQQLFDAVIPSNYKQKSNEYKKIALALLLELDNIVSASAVSQFETILECDVYGGVPSFGTVKDDLVADNNFLNHNAKDSYILNFNFNFLSKNNSFSPDFFWVLSPEFVERVRSLILRRQN